MPPVLFFAAEGSVSNAEHQSEWQLTAPSWPGSAVRILVDISIDQRALELEQPQGSRAALGVDRNDTVCYSVSNGRNYVPARSSAAFAVP
jgi:hypothetical protein